MRVVLVVVRRPPERPALPRGRAEHAARLEDADWDVREAAAKALAQLGDHASPAG